MEHGRGSQPSTGHLWFEAKFGEPYGPLSCTAEALERFTSATFAVGVRLEPDNYLYIEAPFGLADLFGLRLRPNPHRKTVGFAQPALDVRRRWPEVAIDDGPRSLIEPPLFYAELGASSERQFRDRTSGWL